VRRGSRRCEKCGSGERRPFRRRSPLPWLSLLTDPPLYAVCGAVAATVAAAGAVPVGAAVVVAGVAGASAGAAGTGAATGVETGEVVTGVTTSFAVMEPLTAFFRFLDEIRQMPEWRSARRRAPGSFRLRENERAGRPDGVVLIGAVLQDLHGLRARIRGVHDDDPLRSRAARMREREQRARTPARMGQRAQIRPRHRARVARVEHELVRGHDVHGWAEARLARTEDEREARPVAREGGVVFFERIVVDDEAWAPSGEVKRVDLVVPVDDQGVPVASERRMSEAGG